MSLPFTSELVATSCAGLLPSTLNEVPALEDAVVSVEENSLVNTTVGGPAVGTGKLPPLGLPRYRAGGWSGARSGRRAGPGGRS